MLENGEAMKKERDKRDECDAGKKKKVLSEPFALAFLFLLFNLFFFPLLLPLDFFIVFLGRFCLVLGISFLHSKKNIEACDYEVEEGGLGARVHEMHPAPMDTAPQAKRTTTTETKTSEKKNRTFFYVFISTHPLPLSLIVPSVANTLSARNAAKTISQR
jgi:hypothetical protein